MRSASSWRESVAPKPEPDRARDQAEADLYRLDDALPAGDALPGEDDRLRLHAAEVARAERMMSLGEFASSIAHEVNQPVGGIMANASAALRWLDRAEPDLEEARAALRRIVRDAERTSAVIARARAKLVKEPVALEPLDLNALLQEALLFIQAERGGRGAVRIETRLDPALPLVTADRVQLQQVAVNLFVNAMDAMRHARGRRRVLTVTSGLDPRGDIFVSVADTGCGLGEAGPQRAFEPFFTTKADGLGLGLPISRSIVEGYGGALTARANPPQGAVFTFTLPISEGAA